MKNITYKSIIPTLVFISVFCGNLFAQNDRKEKIQQLKIAFFTKELDLSSEEAEKFWPIYNEMESSMKTEKRKQKKIGKEIYTGGESLSEKDYKEKSNAILNSRIKVSEIQLDYHEKIGEVIGYKKATKLLGLEQRFKKELLNRVHNGPKPRPNEGRGGPRNNQ